MFLSRAARTKPVVAASASTRAAPPLALRACRFLWSTHNSVARRSGRAPCHLTARRIEPETGTRGTDLPRLRRPSGYHETWLPDARRYVNTYQVLKCALTTAPLQARAQHHQFRTFRGYVHDASHPGPTRSLASRDPSECRHLCAPGLRCPFLDPRDASWTRTPTLLPRVADRAWDPRVTDDACAGPGIYSRDLQVFPGRDPSARRPIQGIQGRPP